MVLGKLFHYTFDAILVSTVLGGIKRGSGYGLSPTALGLPEGTATDVAQQYLSIGEKIFDAACAGSYTSKFFTKQGKP